MKKITEQKTRYLIVWALIFWMFGLIPASAFAQDADKEFFKELQNRLIKDGFDSQLIKKIYADEQVHFESKSVAQYFLHNEASLDYKKMTKKSWIREGRVYMREQAAALDKAEKQFGVDPEVITAIILVETKFGRYVGNRSIINTFSTMAALNEAQPREYLWEKLPKEKRFERNRYDQKADKKSQWAYKELKAFITYTSQHKIDPITVKGSYAGAMGIAQFIPSSILAYAQDGNGDGRIDLFQDADAIISIASYLKHFGWKPGIDSKKAFKVVYTYNHSKYYVNTVLKIAELLEG